MFGTPGTIDGIMKGFSKAVLQLENHIVKNSSTATGLKNVIIQAEERVGSLENDSRRAQRILFKLNEIMD